MENRKRNIQMKFYVTEEEKRLIDEKIFNLLHRSEASVYVAKSFLILNNWTINRFCQEYNISIEKVQLINDGN